MAGVVVYVLVDVVLQLLPPRYDLIHEAESNLAVGPFGWIMNLNFLGRAGTTFLAVAAVRSLARMSPLLGTGLALLSCGGASSAVLAFAATDVDVLAGSSPSSYSAEGLTHLLVAAFGFLSAFAAVLVLTVWLVRARPLPGPTSAVAMAFAAITTVGAAWLAFTSTVDPALLGLAERTCLLGLLGWTFTVCDGIRRSSSVG